MRKCLALVLTVFLWFSCAQTASAELYGNLQKCADVPAFQERAQAATDISDVERFESYSNLLCGKEDGLPRLITDGNWAHANEFIIPGLLFLYITGWIGWVGRKYLRAIKEEGAGESKELTIDVPLALKCSLSGFAWPLEALQQLANGDLTAKDEEIPVSPR